MRNSTDLLLHRLQLPINHLYDLSVVICHNIVDLPLCLGEDILNIGPSPGYEAIDRERVEFSLKRYWRPFGIVPQPR